ncbi:hypothetical protein [Candidatus Burkholderia verschuerenii]|uniref:hypothetical protein n=1 Tax=Candidatus Burkholderia verschuerenii TaxID=242163 RepID=UPI00067BAEAA|nr:hypothetical protein [Candidatus Burkholderia verschuerenii]
MTARWETNTRWYEAEIFCDLFGSWTVVRAWGGKGSRRHGGMIDVVQDEAAAVARIEVLSKEHSRRNPPYQRVA